VVRYRCEGRPVIGELITVQELARLSRVHPDMVAQLVDWGLVEPEIYEPELLFSESLVPRIWRILRLRQDLGINLPGIGVVLELLGKIESMEREIARLRKQTQRDL
jgi:DNA-binding transcriptional MerR regulator